MKHTKQMLSFRIDAKLLARLRKATAKAAPYTPTMTQVIERGIELALAEMEQKK